MPASVPQPTGAPDTACCQRGPASPHRCVVCAPDSRVRRQPHGLKDCHTLCPHRCWGFFSVGCGRSTTMAPRVASNNLASWTLAPATIMLNGPPSPSTRRLRLLPALPRSVELGPIRSPKTCLAHGSVCRLPFPVHAAQLFAPLHQSSPHSAQHTPAHPPLKSAMDSAVVSKFFWQSVPLAPAAQPEDDAIEHLSRGQRACGLWPWAGLPPG